MLKEPLISKGTFFDDQFTGSDNIVQESEVGPRRPQDWYGAFSGLAELHLRLWSLWRKTALGDYVNWVCKALKRTKVSLQITQEQI